MNDTPGPWLPCPTNPHWDDQDRALATVVANIVQEALTLYAQYEAEALPMLERRARMAGVLDHWMSAIEGLYDAMRQHEQQEEARQSDG